MIVDIIEGSDNVPVWCGLAWRIEHSQNRPVTVESTRAKISWLLSAPAERYRIPCYLEERFLAQLYKWDRRKEPGFKTPEYH